MNRFVSSSAWKMVGFSSTAVEGKRQRSVVFFFCMLAQQVSVGKARCKVFLNVC